MRGRLHLDGHALCYIKAESGQLIDLVGVVGEKAHALYAQCAQDLRAYVVLALIGGKAQRNVGLECIHALLLQLICLELVDQAYAAALLAHVQHYAAALVLDLGHGGGELLAAVAAQ